MSNSINQIRSPYAVSFPQRLKLPVEMSFFPLYGFGIGIPACKWRFQGSFREPEIPFPESLTTKPPRKQPARTSRFPGRLSWRNHTGITAGTFCGLALPNTGHSFRSVSETPPIIIDDCMSTPCVNIVPQNRVQMFFFHDLSLFSLSVCPTGIGRYTFQRESPCILTIKAGRQPCGSGAYEIDKKNRRPELPGTCLRSC